MIELYAILSVYRGKVILWDFNSLEEFNDLMARVKPMWAILVDDDGTVLKRYKEGE